MYNFVGPIPPELIINGTAMCHTDRWDGRANNFVSPINQQIGKRKYRLTLPFASRVGNIVSVAKVDFWYDGFSVPRMFHWFQSPMTGFAAVTVDHDGGYGTKLLPRGNIDDRFYKLLRHYGESDFRATIMTRKVKRWGWWPWMRKTEDDVIDFRSFFSVFEIPKQLEEFKVCLVRQNALAYMRQEIKRCPHKEPFINECALSVLSGDIDEMLLQDERNLI